MARRNDTSKVDALLASITEDMLGEGPPQTLMDNSIRVERILLEMLRLTLCRYGVSCPKHYT